MTDPGLLEDRSRLWRPPPWHSHVPDPTAMPASAGRGKGQTARQATRPQTLPGTVPRDLNNLPSKPGLPPAGVQQASAALSSYADHGFADAASTQRGEDMGDSS